MQISETLFQRLALLDEAAEALTGIRVCDASPSFSDAFARCRSQLEAARERLDQARALEVGQLA